MMSVPFKTVSSINPRDMTLLSTYDAPIVSHGSLHFDVLTVLIIQIFTLIYLWVAGVLGRFMEVVQLQVLYGTQVKLSVLGTLRPTLISPDLKTATTVSSALTTKAGIHLHSRRKLRKTASSLVFEKVVDPSIAAASTTAVSTVGTASQLSG